MLWPCATGVFHHAWVPDGEPGWRFRSNLRQYLHCGSDSLPPVLMDTDGEGFRNVTPEGWVTDYAQGQTFVIGDSFMLAGEVGWDQSFAVQLEKALGESVVNLSCGVCFRSMIVRRALPLRVALPRPSASPCRSTAATGPGW